MQIYTCMFASLPANDDFFKSDQGNSVRKTMKFSEGLQLLAEQIKLKYFSLLTSELLVYH